MHSGVRTRLRDGVGELVLARPEALNALDSAMIDGIDAAVRTWERDEAVRVILLRAEGRHFAAGADIAELSRMSSDEAARRDFAGCSRHLHLASKPVVAAVQGLALGGGCELVEMCDVVVAAEDAAFGHPEIELATMPGAGGTQRLPRLVGLKTAMDMLLTARRLDAAEALQAGLVSRVVPADRLESEAWAVAALIAAMPAEAARAIKAAAALAWQAPLAAGLTQERRAFHETLDAEEFRGRAEAFLARRRRP